MQNVLTDHPEHDAAGVSIQGPREHQEDVAALTRNRYAVFDGLGGHAGGEIAARAAAQGFLEAGDLVTAIHRAVGAVQSAQRREKCWAMTTIVAVEIVPGELRYAWAGDSRLYLFRPALHRQGVLGQVTRDHAIPGTHTVLRCLGSLEAPEFGTQSWQPGDVILLCSDGLTNALSTHIIGRAILAGGTASEIADRLIRLAAVNPCDNTTVVVIKV